MMFRKNCLLLLMICHLTAWAQFPVAILAGDYPDPSIVRDGQDYYMTHSACYYQPGFLIWHSRDLFHWEPVCRAVGNFRGSAWAPDFQKVGDTFYIYYPADGTNWVTTAKDVRGPWTEPVDLHIGGIDPGLVVTPEGKRYLFTNFGKVTPLTSDGLARDGETKTVYRGWTYPKEWQTECFCLESPKLTYHDGYYYMTSAEGGTAGPATSHMAVCARARDIYGPWEESPYNPIVHTYSADERWWSKGHGTIVEGPDGQWWIVYHAYNRDAYALGRYTLIEPIEWTKGGWYRPVKDYPCDNVETSSPVLSDDFASAELGWQWTGWNENLMQAATIERGALCLLGRGTSPKDARLALITAMDTHYAIQAEVTIDKKRGAGGLLLFYNEKAYAGILADHQHLTVYRDSASTQQQHLILGQVFSPEALLHGTFAVPNTYGTRLTLRLENRGGQLAISVRNSDGSWLSLAKGIDVSAFHHNNFGEFVALRPALCAVGDAKVRFRHFVYERLAPSTENK